METDSHRLPGHRKVHHVRTRSGEHLAVLHTSAGRSLLFYGADDPDAPERSIALDEDEADRLADLLHGDPIRDRLDDLERRLDDLVC
ncbi:hypothetical protein [Amycolatopsis sp. 195334CR]|uniref:hypothetical protein n=1 Tax=Amycolatopsis sp. 195334CR TaxID=2814588 RepID=UPI001A8CC76E|nr:hypothetical protein [Amycolatopsis sp. 195334CR]MBN6039612.1 hypothetical protein [Amycolatopsis sp. 195334CR]